MPSPFDPVTFAHGPAMANRFMLAPLTNQQSHADGSLSDEEYRWLTKRAEGGFGLTMTCASHVQRGGQAFEGQLGCYDDALLPGLTRLASGIKAHGSLAVVQLHHGGRRASAALSGLQPVAPMDDPDAGARALTTAEVEALIEDFVAAAVRCEQAGFDGVELHGAHDYVLCEFLHAEFNQRTDRFGGSFENRRRPLLEIVAGIRERCSADFNLSVRFSPERFGQVTREIAELVELLAASGDVDFVDLSMWDVFKEAVDEEFAGRPLLEVFTGLDRGAMRLAVAGHLYTGADVQRALDAGADMVALGRAAITNHDFPRLMAQDPTVAMRALPVPRATLTEEGLSPSFVTYMANWAGFVEEA